LVILIALIALAVAAPAEKKPSEKNENNKESAANDEKKPVEKPEEKKDEERKGLQWPLPDPVDEGDLMLHGSHLFDRVEELHKAKVEKDEDKMVLSVGREYLRRVHKYIEKTTDFKVLPVLCRDTERMENSSDRWEIRILPGKPSRFNPWGSFATDGQTQKQQSTQTEQQATKQQNDAPPSKETKQQNDPIVSSNATHELNGTENSNATDIFSKDHSEFDTIRKEYYKRMGDNFGRLLMKRYRKEKLEKEETEWLARWVSDESIHYGTMSIFCHEGENVKDITKRIATLINEKP